MSSPKLSSLQRRVLFPLEQLSKVGSCPLASTTATYFNLNLHFKQTVKLPSNCYAQHICSCCISFPRLQFQSKHLGLTFMKLLESVATWVQKKLSELYSSGTSFYLFSVCNLSVSSCSSCSQSFSSVVLAKQSQFLAVSIDQLKCSQVLIVEAHFVQGQLCFLQFTATPHFRLHNKAFCRDSLGCVMLVITPSCLSFRTCSQPPIDFVG